MQSQLLLFSVPAITAVAGIVTIAVVNGGGRGFFDIGRPVIVMVFFVWALITIAWLTVIGLLHRGSIGAGRLAYLLGAWLLVFALPLIDRVVSAQQIDGDSQSILHWVEAMIVVHGLLATWHLVLRRRRNEMTSLRGREY
ncbi:MAG: hypothetical protein SF187_05375 [Deltaproteobacteria bacterium]|nr:hypothetical protein [Deltaproteobacteria bacterium]